MELAIPSVRDDVLTAGISSQDRALAISISNAMLTDGNILASICHEEYMAEQDRLYVAALDDDDDALNAPVPTSNEPHFDNESDAGEGPSHRSGAQRARAMVTECVSFLEQFETSCMFLNACDHGFWLDCTRQMFLGVIKDEELYPPRCCGHVVPPGTALRVLNYEELRRFSDRALEYTSKNRIYYADPTCSKFIPPLAIEDDHGTCPACQQKTHLPCRSLEHSDVDCPMDETLQRVLAIADAAS